MIEFYLVDVKNITCDIPRSSFTDKDLDKFADLILQSEGNIKPLVLEVTGLENYKVVNGYFEYYAAVRAMEKDPRKGEMVNAFVISPKSEDIVLKQIEAYQELESNLKPEDITFDPRSLESHITKIELRFEKRLSELKTEQIQERQRVDIKFKEIERQIPQRIEPLNLLNTLNQEELAIKLQRSRVAGAEKIAKAIFESRKKKKNKEFENYRDVVKSVNGLGEKTMLAIVDEWSK